MSTPFALVGASTATPTAVRACSSATLSAHRLSATWFAAPRLRRGRDRCAARISPGNETHLSRLRHRGDPPRTPHAARSTSTPRRNSPARSCSPPVKKIFSFGPVYRNRERGRCITPNSPCSNGVAPARPGEPDGRLRAPCSRSPPSAGAKRFAFRGREADPLRRARAACPSHDGLSRHAGIDLLATVEAPTAPPTATRVLRPPSACRRHAHRAWRHLVRPLQPRHGRGRRARTWARVAPTIALRIPDPGSRASPARARATRALPSASNSIAAASNSPAPSASLPTQTSSAAVSAPTWTRRKRSTASAIRSTRIF